MPHALPVPSSGLQALILCGPGLSLNTFTSNPDEFPKALVPIANRPMLWYPLDICYRSGITKIHVISPTSSAKAIEVALSQNPHLTSLPLPRADVLSSPNLSLTSGTAEILRLPEVCAVVQGDFIVLPCDLVCEVPGESFIETWMLHQRAPAGVSRPLVGKAITDDGDAQGDAPPKGGFGVWFQTKIEGDNNATRQETDFIVTTPIEPPVVRPPSDSLAPLLSRLVYSTTADTLKDLIEEKGSFEVRHGLLKRFGRVRILNTYRDAHIYIFPFWILEMARLNPDMDSISEDIVGWWSKAGWQNGLARKLKLSKILDPEDTSDHSSQRTQANDEEADVPNRIPVPAQILGSPAEGERDLLASRKTSEVAISDQKQNSKLEVPSMLAYIHSSSADAPLIRRVDTTALLTYVSLRLAKLESIDEVGKSVASPFAHMHKIAHPGGIAQRCTITKADCLLAENVTVEEKAVIKESVIGANCQIKNGARLVRCVLMDGVVVGEKCQLTNCILGRRAMVGRESTLKECEVQDGNMVPEETDAKGEKFMVFEGLDDDDDGDDDKKFTGTVDDDRKPVNVDDALEI